MEILARQPPNKEPFLSAKSMRWELRNALGKAVYRSSFRRWRAAAKVTNRVLYSLEDLERMLLAARYMSAGGSSKKFDIDRELKLRKLRQLNEEQSNARARNQVSI